MGKYLKYFTLSDFILAGQTNEETLVTNLKLLRPFVNLKKRRHGELWIADL